MGKYSTGNVSFGMIFEEDDIEKLRKKLESNPKYEGRSDELMDIVSEIFHDGYTHCIYYDGDENTAECIILPDGTQRSCSAEAFAIDAEKFPKPYKTVYSPKEIETEFRSRFGFMIPDGFDIQSHIGILVGEVYTG